MNVLLTCAGRRNYLIEYFKSSIGDNGRVYAANNTTDVSSMMVADEAVLLPSIYDDNYIELIIKFCVLKDISLIVPLFDLELPILARHKNLFLKYGITVAVSNSKVCDICLDKVSSWEFLKKNHFDVKPLFTDLESVYNALTHNEISFPLYIKPRLGMGSIGVYKARNLQQLSSRFELVRDEIQESYLSKDSNTMPGQEVIIQEALPGTHFLLDVVNDFNGVYRETFVKKPLSRWAGEANCAMTMDVPELREIGRNLAQSLRHLGNLDIDIFWNGTNGYILDMNPRFGGGYPFSHIAGVNIPAAYLAWANDEEPDPSWFKVAYNVKSVKGISLHKERERVLD